MLLLTLQLTINQQLVQMMVYCPTGDKSFTLKQWRPDSMMYICTVRPQWVKRLKSYSCKSIAVWKLGIRHWKPKVVNVAIKLLSWQLSVLNEVGVYISNFTDRSEWHWFIHYRDVIMSAMASRITGVAMVCSTVCSDQRNYQSSAFLAFVRRIHRWPVNSLHKGPVTRKMFPFDDAIMW